MRNGYAPVTKPPDVEVTVENLQRALFIAAQIVEFHGEKHLWVFERIEAELEKRTSTMARVKAVLAAGREHTAAKTHKLK